MPRRLSDDTSKRSRPATATRRAPVWAALAVVALTFAAFLPGYAFDYAAHEGFVWDDDDHFLDDPLIRSDDGWWRIWFDPQPGIVGAAGGAVVWNYWPLTRTSFWIERRLWGTDAGGRPSLLAARLTNVALHAANALLLLVVLRRLAIPGAELAALLFAVHPVTVESVAWITERKALLSTFWFLLALVGWLRFDTSGRPRWYGFTCLAYLLALMAKTSTVMFPVVLLLIRGYQHKPWSRRVLLRLAPLFAMSAIAGVTSIVFEHYFIGSAGPAWSAGLGERAAAAGWIAWFYLGKLILPLDLAFNYPRWQIDATSPLSYLPSVAIVAGTAVFWRYRKGWARPMALAFGCFLANLFPVLGFFDIYGMRYAHVADHWQYLACTSIIALAAGLGVTGRDRIVRARPDLARSVKGAAVGVAAVALAGLAGSTWHQSSAYVDRSTLWRHTLERQPRSLLANNNVGTHLLRERRYAEAALHFRKVIELDPSQAEPYLNLGLALDASGDRDQAERVWRRLLERDPEQTHALHHLAVIELKRKSFDTAEELLRRSLLADPTNARARASLAWLYRKQGRPDALAEFLSGVERPPRTDRVTGGRQIALAVWAAMVLALVACGGVAILDAQRPEPAPRSSGRRRTA